MDIFPQEYGVAPTTGSPISIEMRIAFVSESYWGFSASGREGSLLDTFFSGPITPVVTALAWGVDYLVLQPLATPPCGYTLSGKVLGGNSDSG